MSMRIFNAGCFVSRGRGRHPERVIASDELIVVTQGRLEMFEDDRIWRLEPGDWLLLRHGHRHGGINDYPKNLSFFWIHFLDENGDFFDALPCHGHAAGNSPLAEYLRLFLTEQTVMPPDAEAQSHLFSLITIELGRSASNPCATAPVSPTARAAMRYLELHRDESLTVAGLADILGCNIAYLGRLFHRVYGESVSGALNRLRVEKAAGLLLSSQLSIKEIATGCGYASPLYFRRRFAGRFNMTPGQYRRIHTLGHRNTE
ncbi:MAG: helix-turn-helix domain-containing protein [Victivallaceae bacterium]|nr:helix-turn-helix domain-containing protein [Victivallaceae bacterium]